MDQRTILALVRCIRRLPCFRGEVALAPLAGGISNRNFAARDGRREFVVRAIGGDRPEHGIVRAHEIAATRAAQAAGIGPELAYAEKGLMVLRRIPGRSLTPEAIRDAAAIDRIAALLARAHRRVGRRLQGPAGTFWPFRTVRDYLARLREAGRTRRRHAAWSAGIPVLEQAAGPIARVFTHNDLMPGNLIDDGTRLWLIDWEFAGWGAPFFDLAGVAVNNALDPALRRRLLARYLGRAPRAAEIRRFAAFRLAAVLRESLWGSVQELTGGLDFDYAGYAGEHAEAVERAWRDWDTQRFA